MAYMRLAGKVAGTLEKLWRAAVRSYPDISLSYTKHAGGPGYSTSLSPHTQTILGFFNIEAKAENKPQEYICRNGILTVDTGVPIGECEVEKPKVQNLDIAP